MLVAPTDSALGALGAILSAVIVVLSAAGLTMHGDFYAGRCRRDYWVYYTNQSNLLVFLYFALLSPFLYGTGILKEFIPHAEFALMLCVMLTHLVFHHFLSPFIAQETIYTPHAPNPRIAHAASLVQHYAVPLFTFAYWLLCAPGKSSLSLADAFYWLSLPLSYVLFVLVRAKARGCIHKTRSAYPYPFLDLDFFGKKRVIRLLGILLFLCAGASLLLVLTIRVACFLCSLWV